MTAKESLVFATWNVENLFLPSPNGFGARNQETYDAKIAYLAQTITAMAPDGIALQEIGQAESAADLAQALGGWQSGLSGHPDIRGIRTAVLTPHTITGTTELWAFPDGAMESVPGPDGQVLAHMGRGMVVASIRTPAGTEVQLASVHLKSKLLTFPNNRRFPINEDERASGAGYALLRRAAEAVAVRATLNRIMPAPNGVPTILAGDFNDGPGAVTTDPCSGSEAPASSRSRVVLPAPLLPTTPTTSPGDTVRSRPSKRVRWA